jgi:hypothetical protein
MHASSTADVVPRLRSLTPAHPRLHFDAAGREELRERARGTHRRYADLLLEWVRAHSNWSPPAHLPDEALDEVILEECAAFVTNAALAAVVSGEVAHRDLARKWALAMCDLPRGDLANYGLGLYAAGLARAYDWLHDDWSDPERDRMVGHLSRLVESLHAGSFAETERAHWWAGAHLHHDFWVPVCGFGEASLALLGEVLEAADWASRAWTEMQTCFSWLGGDGAWHEGAADWCYALAPLLWFYGAWQSVTGDDPHDIPWLRETARFRLAHSLPDGTYVYLNDSFRSGRYNTSGSAGCHLLRRLASLFRDPEAQWLADRDEEFDLRPGPKGVYQAPYEGSSYRAARVEYPHPDSQCAAWNLLWHDPTVPSLPAGSRQSAAGSSQSAEREEQEPIGSPNAQRQTPSASHFPNASLAILRTGWTDGDAVVSLACGPLAGHRCAERMRGGEPRMPSNFSHAHADYNALTLFADGQYFLVPPGYARRASAFQNSLAVNGADLVPDPSLDIRLLEVSESPGCAAAVGDATAAFPTHLGVERWHRHVRLFDDCLVLYDDLRLESRRRHHWNRLEWRLHSDPATHLLTCSGAQARWTPREGSGNALRLDIVAPQDFAWETSILVDLEGHAMLETLRLVKPEWCSERIEILAVLSWGPSPAAPRLAQGEGWPGVYWPGRPDRPPVGLVPRISLGTSGVATVVSGAL